MRAASRFPAALTVVIAATCLLAAASPADAQGRLRRAADKARQAVTDKPATNAAQAGNNAVAITNESIDAYIAGSRALTAEIKRLTALEEIANKPPALLRLDSLQACYGPMPAQEANPTMDRIGAQAQARSQGGQPDLKTFEQAAGMSMEEMEKLSNAAEKGDTAAKRKLTEAAMKMSRAGQANMGGGVAVSDADSKKIQAVTDRNAATMDVYYKRRERCDREVPADAYFARPVAAAKSELQRVGEPDSERRRQHLDKIKLDATDGALTLVQFDGLFERIVMYLNDDRESPQGFSKEELAVLRARKPALEALRAGDG